MQLDDALNHDAAHAYQVAETKVARARGALGFGTQLPADRAPDAVLTIVSAYLRAVAVETDPVPPAIAAARTLLFEAPRGIAHATPAAFDQLEAAVEPAFRRMMDCTPRDVIGDEMALGFASIRDLARLLRDPAKRADPPRFEKSVVAYLDAIALLADTLDASVRRERLADWMGANAHAYAVWRAVRCDDGFGLPLH